MIDHADRFWTSDQNDPLERQQIQRYTGMVIPPEFLGTHVGPTVGHQMNRTHDIHFRVINALFGHAGIEWDITEAIDRELDVLNKFAAFYKVNRGLLHSGRVVRSDIIVGNAYLYGTVAQDKSEAIYSYMQLASNNNFGPLVATFEGLDAATLYTVTVNEKLSAPEFLQKAEPGWWPTVKLTGEELANVGLQLPVMKPESGLLFEIKTA
jgi:alpha-galactosidase